MASMLFVVADWLDGRQRGGVLLCCASQSPFFNRNSGVRTHVSPSRQLDAIYESCPSSPAATRPCGWLRLLTGSLGQWRRLSSVWLATLLHCGPCAIDTRDSWSCKNMRPYHESRGRLLIFSSWYIYQPVVLILFIAPFSFSIVSTESPAPFVRLSVRMQRCPSTGANNTCWARTDSRREYCIGASASPDTTGLMSSVALMLQKRKKIVMSVKEILRSRKMDVDKQQSTQPHPASVSYGCSKVFGENPVNCSNRNNQTATATGR